jgi:3-oxoacyl-[acyl-carrier protein] reductase
MIDRPVMVISGTSRGIGRGMAEYFVEKGYRVAGCSRGVATLKLEGYHHTQLDVGEESQVREWVRRIKKDFKRIDVLVCNAGLVRSALLMTVTPSEVLETFLRTHVAGTYYVCREVSKVMIPRKYGRIVTVSSLGVPLHLEGTSAYSATKSAIVEMTKIIAKELAPLGITCNVIGPALIETESVKAMGQEWFDRLLEKQTIKRAVTIAEICNVVSFFAAPESGCITGQVINMGLVV